MRTPVMWLCGAICSLVLAPIGWADPQDISARLAEEIQASSTPGVVYREYQGENLIARGKAGTRMLGQDSPVTDEDVIHWGSMGKAQTALLCANLIQAGVLESFDAKLVDHVTPEQRDALLAKDPRYGLIRLRMLLGMSSGIDDDMVTDDYSDPWLWSQYRYNLETALGRKVLVDELAESYKLSADPGTTYYYSNVGYTLAGYMAETAWNRKHPSDRMTYEELMQERVFKPLGITTAHPGSPGMTMIYSGFILPADPTPLLDKVGVTIDLLDEIRQPHIRVQGQMYFTLGWLRDMSEPQTLLHYQGSNERWISTVSINVPQRRMKIAGSNSGTDENGVFMRKLVQLSDTDPHEP